MSRVALLEALGYLLFAIKKKRLKIEASLYTILQVLSVTIFERSHYCRHLQIQTTEAKRIKIITNCFNSTKRWDTTVLLMYLF